ncbi:MAG: DALR domain-containing protein, partial [Humibacter sp.]
AGEGFAGYWGHNGLVNVGGLKMSKSLGNSVSGAALRGAARPLVVRYYLGSAHYRSTIDFTEGSLAEAEAAMERISGFLDRVDRRLAGTRFASSGVEVIPNAFAAAMDDDFGVPQALAVLHDTVRAGNQALDGEDLGAAASARGQVVAMTEVLGINPLSATWKAQTDSPVRAALDALLRTLLADRQAARQARDFAAADRIRSELAEAGITIEDTPTGAHWSIDGE